MQTQKIGALDTHNLTLTTFLPSHQIKHLAYIRIDAPKSILYNNVELRLITGLVAATINTIKLYAVYEHTVAFELGSWRLHEDIVGIVGWDKIIIVYASNKVVGLRYESGCLKNSFLVSLQFLPIDAQDVCRVYADRMGYYFVIHIKNYLLICFSETLANKYKARVVQKQKVYIVDDEAKWNQPNHNYILDMIQIKLFEHELCKIQQLHLIDETIYFMGHCGKESQLYYIHVYFFFTNMESSKSITNVPHHDQPPPNTKVMVFHPHLRTGNSRDPQFLYYNGNSPSILLKSQQTTYEVAVFQTNCEIFSQGISMFPILVWQTQKSSFCLIEKQRTFQQTYQFKMKQVINNFCAEVVAYREGLIALASRTELLLISSSGQRQVLHRSLGSIIDFHVGKDMLIIENYERKLTRLYEISRGPRIDPRPFVTHKRKRFLETLPDLQSIYSLVLGKQSIQILAVRRGSGSNKLYSFYREGATQFDAILEEASNYLEATIGGEPLLILKTKEGVGKIVRFNDKQEAIQQLIWDGWKMQKRWCISEYLIAWSCKVWSFINLNTRQQILFQLSVEREGQQFLNSFLQFRQINADKSLKDHPLVELYLCYSGLLQIWLLDLTIGSKSLIYVSKNISEGCPFLSNQLINPGSYQTDKFRSITCPDYSLNEHGVHFLNSEKKSIISSYVYKWQTKSLLLLVTSDEQLLIYRKYFNIEDGGFLFSRINTPLNIIKNFKWTNEKAFVDLGQGVIRLGNFLLYKGELLESITGRSLFKMEGSLWALVSEGKIRLVQLGSGAIQGFSIRQIDCGLKQEMMGIDSTSHYYCVYSRKAFQIFTKQFVSHWRATLGNETIVSLKMFEHYVGMSYYDYYCDEDGVNDYRSIRFRFRIYNCTTKTKIVERQKALDQPILHIRYIVPDKLLLVTSSLIFINVLKNQKTLELFRTHNFSSKRSFLSTFSYIPDIVSTNLGSQSSPGYMLFGGSHGGLGFFVGKWLEEDKLKEQWFEGFRCGIREVSFLQFGEEKEELKALVADEDGNLIVLNLKKDHAQKLADFRLGAIVNSFKSRSGQDRVKYCSLDDGSIKLLTAVKLDNPEVSYLDFQNYFCNQLPFLGGFNLRVSRQLLQKYRSGRLVSKGNVVDGDILQNFFSLTSTLQQHIVRESEMQISALKGILPF